MKTGHSASAGTGPNSDSTNCVACSDGWYSAFGVCTECLVPRVVNGDKTACVDPSLCAAGTECTRPGGCDSQEYCSVCHVGAVSTSGGFCQPCLDPGKVA
eukprot:COSAG02_NODE_26019_length_643_cov_0.814338_1_plen_99_part_10